MRQRRLGNVDHAGTFDGDGMNRPTVGIGAAACIHGAIILVNFFDLVYVAIRFAVAVFYRMSKVDDGRVHDCSRAHQQFLRGHGRVDGRKKTLHQTVDFQQTAKLQQRNGTWRIFMGQINPDIGAHLLNAVVRILNGFVRQAKPSLNKIYPQRERQIDWWTTAAGGRKDWGDHSLHFCPLHQLRNPRQKFLASCKALLVGKFHTGKTNSFDHHSKDQSF